jgi:hypothetical protein
VSWGGEYFGLTLTDCGVDTAEDLKTRLRMQADATPDAAAGLLVKCGSCCRIFLETTDSYIADWPVIGHMLSFIEKYRKQRWSLPFSPHESHSCIICPGCDAPLLNVSARFLPDVLISPEEEKEADGQPDADAVDPESQPNETAESTGRKLTDEELLKMVDEGKTQVEIAELLGCSKQNINKRLKLLRKNAA